MSKWLKPVLPVTAVLAIIAATALWGLPNALAAISGPGHPAWRPAAAPQAQPGDNRAFLGIKLANIAEQIKNRLQLPADQGVVVVQVMKDSPAATAGVQEKDIITAVDGKAVKTVEDVTGAVQAKKAGETLTLSVLRGNQPALEIRATLGAAPAAPEKPKRPKAMFPGGFLPEGLGGLLGLEPRENLRSATITLTDKNGNERTVQVVSGTVQSADSARIMVTPNGLQSTASFDITAETRVGRGKVTDLKPGDRVVVVAEGGKALTIANLTVTANKSDNRPRGPFNFQFHRFLPGKGSVQPSP